MNDDDSDPFPWSSSESVQPIRVPCAVPEDNTDGGGDVSLLNQIANAQSRAAAEELERLILTPVSERPEYQFSATPPDATVEESVYQELLRRMGVAGVSPSVTPPMSSAPSLQVAGHMPLYEGIEAGREISDSLMQFVDNAVVAGLNRALMSDLTYTPLSSTAPPEMRPFWETEREGDSSPTPLIPPSNQPTLSTADAVIEL